MLKQISTVWKLSAGLVLVLAAALASLEYLHYLEAGGGTYRLGRVLLLVVVAGGAGSGLTWLIVETFVKRPARDLVDGMNRLAEKELEFRLAEDDRAEFGSIAASFNDMASMLSASLTELRKNQDYVRSIMESSADIIITVNPAGLIQTINAGAQNTLGYERSEVVGKPIDMLFADPRERTVAIEKLKYTDSVVSYQTQFLTRNGEARDVLLSLSRLRNAAGAIIGTVGIAKDVTEEKRLQAKLVQSQRFAAIGEVFTGIQHSMKNMLNACTGGAYMVRTGLAKDNHKMLVEGWAMVQEGITRMTDMSKDMLKYVSEWKPRSGRINLTEPLSDVYNVIKQTAKDKGVGFRMELAPDLPEIAGDSKMLHTAIMDIASNALDACLWKLYDDTEVPEVVMRTRLAEDGTEAIIEISDNGCGMTEDVKANIFTPFFSTKSKAGTGLGLAITSRIIGVHGGHIDVESQPNRGATFRIRLAVDGTTKDKEAPDGQEGTGS
jgi:PAS domain S-box-containing protein